MMQTRIKVRCHSGYRGEEYPESFLCGEEEHKIAEIVDQSLQEDSETRERKRIFLVKTDGGLKFKLIRFVGTDAWYCLALTTDSHK